MNLRSMLLVAIAAAPLGVGIASASAGAAVPGAVSQFALPVVEAGSTTSEIALVPGAVAPAPAQFSSWDGTRLESIRYRPRRMRGRSYDEGPSGSHGFAELRAGFFNPDGDLSNGALFGFRVGSSIEDRLELGLGLDWHHRSDDQSAVVQKVPIPGGGTVERKMELARSTSDLLPIMASVQISPAAGLPLIPYVGAGGGWEVLFLSAEDFTTGDKFDATYGGWGWQVWAGVGIPIAHGSRFNAEAFVNKADVSRDVDDPAGGTFRETVNMDGVGMRFGVSWAF